MSARRLSARIAQATTGGSIPGGAPLRISLCALDENGLPSTPAAIAIVQTPAGTNTNQVTLSGIAWPAVAGLATYAVFVSNQDDLICAQQTGALTAGRGGPRTRRLDHDQRAVRAVHLGAASPYVSKIGSRRSASFIAA